MHMKSSPGNLLLLGRSWKGQLKNIWLLCALTLLLITVGCGGLPSNLGPRERSQDVSWADDGPDESPIGELNAKHLEELYAKSGIKDRDRSIEEELRKWEHQSSFDFPIQMNKQVKAYIIYFSTERKGFTKRSLARSNRYLPMIKEVFREYGLPEDLAYLAMVESGFNPQASSPAGARGMWQFIKGTGLRYGLVINGNVDERLNPEKSTQAAARYLLDLYKQFGSWYLAAASYNCGERRVEKELKKSNYRNFWQLSANKCIPGETRNYVPQMIAATIIARNPQKFGFTGVPYQSPSTPHTSPNIAVVQAEPPPEVESKVEATTLAKPPPAPSHGPQTHKIAMSKQKSPLTAKGSNPKVSRKVCAADHKTHNQNVTQSRARPYVASIFGYSHTPARNSTLASKKRVMSSGGAKVCNQKKPKPSSALLSQKPKAKPTHLAKKNTAHTPKVSKAKSKSKALLVSQAR